MKQLVDILEYIAKGFYYPKLMDVYSETVYPALYLFIIVMVFVWRFISFKVNTADQKAYFRDRVFKTLIVIVFFIVGIQAVGQTYFYIYKLGSKVIGKNMHEKREVLFQGVYPFAMNCKKNLRKPCYGKYYTDMDMKVDPGMFVHRVVSYLLYPWVNLRSYDSRIEPDCLVYFQKDNARELVPEDFKVIYEYDEGSLLAVKRESQ